MTSIEYTGLWLMQMMQDNEEDQLKAALVLQKQKRKRKRQHRFWVHDILKLRIQQGAYNNLVRELALDPDKFREYFRMSEEQFEYVLRFVGPVISKKTVAREPVDARQRLAICIR
jgi:hypothetical protein